jgi:hypothetical protein
MVHNRDLGVLLVDASRYHYYTWRYRGRKKIVKLLKCLLKVLRHSVFYVGFYSLLAARHG